MHSSHGSGRSGASRLLEDNWEKIFNGNKTAYEEYLRASRSHHTSSSQSDGSEARRISETSRSSSSRSAASESSHSTGGVWHDGTYRSDAELEELLKAELGESYATWLSHSDPGVQSDQRERRQKAAGQSSRRRTRKRASGTK
ncbi:hypothetical protein scyTo_0022121 [Scyliorhinus torazame]|uniref:Uncharacterized protein n=3 Tax=Scyliorhinus torazame TaxID=75743 RepID=A0A401Q6X3_SCYTO|nr:hypothetical protein [Scyliorhinus torazame]